MTGEQAAQSQRGDGHASRAQPMRYAQAYDGLLFDMDGTVLTSIAAAERAWRRWATKHGLDVASFLPTIHGVRTIDTVRNSGVPDLDYEAEAQAIIESEIDDVADIKPIDGAVAFLQSLPRDRWAIVTSAPRRLAESRIAAAGLPHPGILVSGDDVEHGKPAPDPFVLGAQRLALPIAGCLVFEDAPAGIVAGESAGADVLVVAATHSAPQHSGHWTIRSYREIHAQPLESGRVRVRPV